MTQAAVDLVARVSDDATAPLQRIDRELAALEAPRRINVRADGIDEAARAAADASEAVSQIGDNASQAQDPIDAAFGGLVDHIGGAVPGLDSIISKFAAGGPMLAGLAAVGVAGAAAFQWIREAGDAASEFADQVADLQIMTGDYTTSLGEWRDAVYDIAQTGLDAQIEDIGRALALTQQQTGATGELREEIATYGLVFQNTFDYSIEESLRGADAAMVNFGTSAGQTFDLLTTMLQQAGDPAQDLLDTFNEYSAPLADAGFAAEDFGAKLVAGVEAGARNYDVVADAIKEFTIRIQDDSVTTRDALADIGLAADDLYDRFASGDLTVAASMDLIIERLRGIEDPIARNAAGVALFGTKWEDLGEEIVLALDSTREALGELEGAAAEAVEAATTGVEAQKRELNAIKDEIKVAAGESGNAWAQMWLDLRIQAAQTRLAITEMFVGDGGTGIEIPGLDYDPNARARREDQAAAEELMADQRQRAADATDELAASQAELTTHFSTWRPEIQGTTVNLEQYDSALMASRESLAVYVDEAAAVVPTQAEIAAALARGTAAYREQAQAAEDAARAQEEIRRQSAADFENARGNDAAPLEDRIVDAARDAGASAGDVARLRAEFDDSKESAKEMADALADVATGAALDELARAFDAGLISADEFKTRAQEIETQMSEGFTAAVDTGGIQAAIDLYDELLGKQEAAAAADAGAVPQQAIDEAVGMLDEVAGRMDDIDAAAVYDIIEDRVADATGGITGLLSDLTDREWMVEFATNADPVVDSLTTMRDLLDAMDGRTVTVNIETTGAGSSLLDEMARQGVN